MGAAGAGAELVLLVNFQPEVSLREGELYSRGWVPREELSLPCLVSCRSFIPWPW